MKKLKNIIIPVVLILGCGFGLNFVLNKALERNYNLRKATCENVKLMFPSAVFNDVCYVEVKKGIYMIHGMPNGRDDSRFYTKKEVFGYD